MIEIFVATHKEYEMPKSKIYKPVWAGAAINPNYHGQYQGDNECENISTLNPGYNELTVLYWGWKNSNASIKGLSHYRRYIGSSYSKRKNDPLSNIIEKNEIETLLADYDVIVPSPRNFYFMGLFDHYVTSKADYKNELREDMKQLRLGMKKLSPEYLPALEKVYKSRKAHMLNMFIMNGCLFNDYCEWLFSIIDEVALHIPEYRKDTTRVAGALSEFLLDVYINTNNLRIVERPLVELEKVSVWKRAFNRIKNMI